MNAISPTWRLACRRLLNSVWDYLVFKKKERKCQTYFCIASNFKKREGLDLWYSNFKKVYGYFTKNTDLGTTNQCNQVLSSDPDFKTECI